MDAGIYHIHRRNLSELESIEHSGLRSNNEIVKLKNILDEKNNSIPLRGKSFNNEDYVKYYDVRNDGKCNNINYDGL